MRISLLILSILVVHISSQKFQAILALSWPEGHCEDLRLKRRTCDPEQYKNWDHKSFTIHGLWPDIRTNQDFGPFDANTVKAIQAKLERVWPPKSDKPKGRVPTYGERYSLWIHQWKEHGRDFALQYLQAFNRPNLPSGASARDKAVQTLYFHNALDAFLTIRGTKLARNVTSKQQLAALLGIKETSFSLRCLASGNLQEIRVCFEATKSGESFSYKVVDCRRFSSNCPNGNFILSNYK